ncbi:MAG: sigma-E processing peptidase SpoIIGA [Clostridia bacterium]|nr:sigma-E processing peptidase SpoIIGA [Clostridia bacterium]
MQSIELFAAINLMMNLLILLLGLRGFAHIRLRQVLAAAFAGTAYSVAALSMRLLSGRAAQIICLMLMSAIAQGGVRRGFWYITCRMTASAFFLGGVMHLTAGRIPVCVSAGIAAGAALIAVFLTDADRRKAEERYVRLRVTVLGKTAVVNALVDTGNRLREPMSGLPVLIVAGSRVPGLNAEIRGLRAGRLWASESRLIRYGVLGADGEMMCVKPESVCKCVDGVWVRTKDVWIGVYEGEIPSGLEAIAPPSLG